MEAETIKLLLANDHSLKRITLIDAFHKTAHIRVIEEAVSYPDLFIKLQQCQPDILMTDDTMPGGSIVKDLPIMRDMYPELKIIVTPFLTHRDYLNHWISFCDGIISFTAGAEDFIKAVETVHNNGLYFFIPGHKK